MRWLLQNLLLLYSVSYRNLPAYLGALGYKWRRENLYRGIEFNGKTLGLVGFGRIGSNVTKYASAME